MRNVSSAVLLGASLVISSPSLAATSCVAPAAPTIPASFADLAAAEATEATVQSYLASSGQYQKCLADEREALGAAITAEEDVELTSLSDSAKAEAKAIAIAYNDAVIDLHTE